MTQNLNSTGEYYAEYDEQTALYCVFDTESAHAYSSWTSMEQAELAAQEMNQSACCGSGV